MQAMLLMEAAERHSGQRPAAFKFRARHPLFHTDRIFLTGKADASAPAMELGTATDAGYLGLTARMEWS